MSQKPANPRKTLSDDALIQWVTDVIRREQRNGTYGTISVHMEAGRIIRSKVERNEVPS